MNHLHICTIPWAEERPIITRLHLQREEHNTGKHVQKYNYNFVIFTEVVSQKHLLWSCGYTLNMLVK